MRVPLTSELLPTPLHDLISMYWLSCILIDGLCVIYLQGYLTDSGIVNLDRVQLIMTGKPFTKAEKSLTFYLSSDLFYKVSLV